VSAVSGPVDANRRSDDLADEAGQLIRFGVSTRGVLGVDQVAVHHHVEDAFVARYQGELFDHMLVRTENLTGRAHGAVGIVSRDAVFD